MAATVGNRSLASLLLTGKAGGQTIIGGTGSGETLTLRGTSHATPGTVIVENRLAGGVASAGNLSLASTTHGTKGKVLFGTHSAFDEANGRWGFGTQSPSVLMHARNVGTAGFKIESTPTTGNAYFEAQGDGSRLLTVQLLGSATSATTFGVTGGGHGRVHATAGPMFVGSTDASGVTYIGAGSNYVIRAEAGSKLGLFTATPVTQPAAVADASGGSTVDAEARTALNALLARVRSLGIIAT